MIVTTGFVVRHEDTKSTKKNKLRVLRVFVVKNT